MNRLSLLVVALAGLVGVLALVVERPGVERDPTRTFKTPLWGIAFSYPAKWRAAHWPEHSSFTDSIVYLGNVPLHNPCRKTGQGRVCGAPVDALPHAGVFVSVSSFGFPDTTLDGVAGKRETIAGRRAKVSVNRPGRCGVTGRDETIEAVISRRVTDNFFLVTACLREPGVAHGEREVRALLDSLRIDPRS
jgi:hypothetical protein